MFAVFKDKVFLRFLLLSAALHVGTFVSVPNLTYNVNNLKEEYIEVECYELPTVMVRAKEALLSQEADPFSREREALSAKEEIETGEISINEKVKETVEKFYRPGMDVPSYAELLYEIIKHYFRCPALKEGAQEKVRIEFSLNKKGRLLFVDIPYGEGSGSAGFNMAALNAVTLASRHFPPLPVCVKKESQLFKIWILVE